MTADDARRPRILCVDDHLSVLAGLSRLLRSDFSITIASSGAEALDNISTAPCPYAVIVSDMVMPGMSGAEFLRRARALSEDSVRVLLSGYADSELTARAINEGGISRLLTKPYSSSRLFEVLNECVAEHRENVEKRRALDDAIVGVADAVGEILSCVAPDESLRVERVANTIEDWAAAIAPPDAWAAGPAARLSRLALLTRHRGRDGAGHVERSAASSDASDASADDPCASAAARMMSASASALARIAHFDVVEQIVAGAARSRAAEQHPISHLLRAAIELDELETSGLARHLAERQVARTVAYRPLSELLAQRCGVPDGTPEEVTIGSLTPDPPSWIARDVLNSNGVLVVPRGTRVTPQLISKLRTSASLGGMPRTVWIDAAEAASEDGTT